MKTLPAAVTAELEKSVNFPFTLYEFSPVPQRATGTIISFDTFVIGFGTLFTSELNVGDVIVAQKHSRVVTAIFSDTRLFIESEFSASFIGPVVFESAATYRFAEFNEDVHFGGRTYLAFPISHDTIRADVEDTVDSVRLAVSNTDLFMSRLVSDNNGLRGGKVTILTVFQNLLDNPDNKIIKFEGHIQGCVVNHAVASFMVTSKLDVQDVRVPRRIFRKDICQWVFKDVTTCKYAGALPTCDKTIEGTNGCRSHNNIQSFGGFPATPEKRFLII